MKPTVKYRKLGREKAYGLAWGHMEGKKWIPVGKIEIDPRQSEKELLDTITHEALHTELPDLSEESVMRVAGVIADLIYKAKFRKG